MYKDIHPFIISIMFRFDKVMHAKDYLLIIMCISRLFWIMN